MTWTSGSGDVIKLFVFLFLALVAILISGLEPFVQLWKRYYEAHLCENIQVF